MESQSYTWSSVRLGRRIRTARHPPKVRVSRTFVNFRIMSSTSVRLKAKVLPHLRQALKQEYEMCYSKQAIIHHQFTSRSK